MRNLIAIILLAATTTHAANYYVDKVNGNNGNPGTSTGSAKATIQAGIDLLSAGDTLFIMGDNEVYDESVANQDFPNSGTSWSSPIVIAGYSNHNVTINPSTTARCFDFTSDTLPKTYIVISNLVLDGTGGANEAAKVQGYNGYIKFTKLLIKDVFNSHGIQVSDGARPAPSGCCNIIDQVTITNCGYAGGSPGQPNHAVYVKTDSNIIEHCTFINNHSHGVHQFGGDYYGNIYRYNIIGTDNGSSNEIGIGIYSGGTNNYAIGNIIFGLSFAPIRLNAPNNYALNNTLIHNRGGLGVNGSGNVVANNIVAYCGNGFSESGIYTSSAAYTSLIISNNLAFDCWGGNDNISSSYTGANNLLSDSYDANFVSTNITYGSLDVRLSTGSNAKNTGVNLSGYFTVDATNNIYGADGTWDMGALESQAGLYFVNWNTGDDTTGTGASGNPWKTFKKGVDTMSGGDTLYVAEGTYAEPSWPPSWKDNITIIGQGDPWATIINPAVDEGVSIYTFGWSSIDYAYIKNLRIQRDTNGSVGGALKLVSLCVSNTFDNVIFDGANDQHNVLISTSSGNNRSGHNLFANCIWTNMANLNQAGGSPPHGLYISGGYHNTFTNCLFAGSANDQCDFIIHLFGDGDSTNNVFDACTFIHGRLENGARTMGLFDGGPGTIVKNSVFTSRDFATSRSDTVYINDPGIIFVNNTIYHERDFIEVGAQSDGVVIANNLFSRNSGTDTWIPFLIQTGATNLVFENNYFVNTTNANSGAYYEVQSGVHFASNTGNRFGTASADTFVEDFVDAAALNFAIGANSDAIDVGRDTSSAAFGSVTRDRNGTLRTGTYDVGAFEYDAGSPPELPPDPPTSLVATADSQTQITLTWSDNDDDPQETSFRIERSLTGGGAGFSEIDSVAAEVLTYVDTGRSAGTTYYYRIRARNAAGDSAYTSEASDTTPAASGTRSPGKSEYGHSRGKGNR